MATTPPTPPTDILPGLSSALNRPPRGLSMRFRRGLLRRYRPTLTASIITLTVSATLLGVIAFSRWQGRQAITLDTDTLITQTKQQLLTTLRSRRSTLTLLRDTLNRRPNLTAPQLEAMASSGAEHTRHLLGVGIVGFSEATEWWAKPTGLGAAHLSELNRAITQWTQRRGIWRVPSTFVAGGNERPVLVMLEPLSAAAFGRQAIVGALDLTPLLSDFFTSNVSQGYPVQLLDGETVLYQAPDWKPVADGKRPLVLSRPFALDAARWLMQMQPGVTPVAQTLSWLNILVIGLGVIAGLGIIAIVWLLAARTWILQRAVERRTAALRRASQRLRQMAITDELTGLYNRRFFMNRWEWECERAKRYQRPLACLMIDVNGFKQVNDKLGHQTGDVVLKHVAQELQTMMRQSDILARFGGDEFVIALPETSEHQASAVAEKLRDIQIQAPPTAARRIPPITLSVGLGRIDKVHDTPEQILEAADQSLYAHKRRVKASLPS